MAGDIIEALLRRWRTVWCSALSFRVSALEIQSLELRFIPFFQIFLLQYFYTVRKRSKQKQIGRPFCQETLLPI